MVTLTLTLALVVVRSPGFLTFREKFAKVKSKRLAKAVETDKRNKQKRDAGEVEPDGGAGAGAAAILEPTEPEEPQPSTVPNKAKRPKKPPKKRAKKDPNAPKKALTAFIYFSNDKRAAVTAELKAANPDMKGVAEVGRKLGEMWRALSDAEKQPYTRQADADKARYGKEMEAHKARLDSSLLPGHRTTHD